jgi:hypothetical protein
MGRTCLVLQSLRLAACPTVSARLWVAPSRFPAPRRTQSCFRRQGLGEVPRSMTLDGDLAATVLAHSTVAARSKDAVAPVAGP